MTETKKSGGSFAAIKSIMNAVFPLYDPDDEKSPVTFQKGSAGQLSAINPYDLATSSGINGSTTSSGSTANEGCISERLYIRTLPHDRFLRYAIYDEMEEDSTIATAIEIHISHALSINNKSGQIVYLEAKDEKDKEYVETLNKELMSKINDSVYNWAWAMCIYGVNYIRPHAKQGKGIDFFECNWYTLPHHVREYERAGQLVGFTHEYLETRQSGEQVRLAEPWALIPLKIPMWRPDYKQQPVGWSGEKYSLYSDVHLRYPIETQNYGTSMLHTAYESWMFLRNAIRSLAKSRQISSIIERLISISTDNLDAQRAAQYLNLVAGQLQDDWDDLERKARIDGYLPAMINSFIPVMTGGTKGGVSIDTFTTDPNIAHIEDIMFHVKRLSGALGVEPSMLGFSDIMSGGLGEGGFFRNAIQAAMRANQIRLGVVGTVKRAIDIHTAYRDGKVWPDGEEPFLIRFNSLNTAIELEAAAARESKANYAMTVTTLLDMFEQSGLNKSETLKRQLYTNTLENMDAESVDKILAELSAVADDVSGEMTDDDMLLESLGIPSQKRHQRYIRDLVLEAMTDFMKLGSGEIEND